MEIEILTAESLGVRGLCCFVKTGRRNILIDPGISLGYIRNGLMPHPVQIEVCEKRRKLIINAWKDATDIVISHFHGDHVPLANANPYQLDMKSLTGLNKEVNIWTKGPCHFSPVEKERARHLSSALQKDFISAEGKKCGSMSFSIAVPHGEKHDNKETVMMTRIEQEKVFVHAPDIQLLDDKAVSLITAWEPDVSLVGGPALYLSRLSAVLTERAWNNAVRLSQAMDSFVLDHHLMRNHEGLDWIARLTSRSGKPVLCAADFMHTPRMLLEADRRNLYEKFPVPSGWHKAYSEGRITTEKFRHLFKADLWDQNAVKDRIVP